MYTEKIRNNSPPAPNEAVCVAILYNFPKYSRNNSDRFVLLTLITQPPRKLITGFIYFLSQLFITLKSMYRHLDSCGLWRKKHNVY